VGFDVQAVQSDGKRRGLGLIGMQERLNAIGETLSIEFGTRTGNKNLDPASDGGIECQFASCSLTTMFLCVRA
jgi:hypothetical protein